MDRSLLAGWFKLVSTNAASGVLHLLGFAIAAQSLEVAVLGTIVLIQAYVRIVDGVFNFQSVNVLTRFLAEADHHRDVKQFRGLVKAGFLVDGLTAVLACALAVATLPVLGTHVNIPEDWTVPAMLFSLVILTRISGVAEAVLRCFGGFWAIGLRGTVSSLLLVVGSLAVWWAGGGPGGFLAVWMLSEVAANVAFIVWTFVVLRQNGIIGLWRARALEAIRRAPGFWAMLWQTNVTFGIRLLSQEADVLIAGAVLGSAAAGLLRAAKNVASILTQFGRPLQQVASAPIARLSAEEKYNSILFYSAKISLCIGAPSFVLATMSIWYGEIIINILYGSEFLYATLSLIFLMIAAAIYLSGVTLLPTMITLGIFSKFFWSIILGSVVFFVTIYLVINPLGIAGIAVAHIALNSVWLVTSWWWVVKTISTMNQSH